MAKIKGKLVKVEGHDDLVKSTESGAVVCVDANALERYKVARAERQKFQSKYTEDIQEIHDELDGVKKQLARIVDILKEQNATNSCTN